MMLPSDESRTPNAPFVLNTSGWTSKSKPIFFQLEPHSLTSDRVIGRVPVGEVSLKWINSKISF